MKEIEAMFIPAQMGQFERKPQCFREENSANSIMAL